MNTLHETIAREVIHGQTDEVIGLVNPINDGNLAAWMMALDRAQRMVGTIQTVCDAISARPAINLGKGQEALRLVASEPGVQFFEVMSPDLEAAFDELEAKAIDRARPAVFCPIESALAMVRPPHLQAGSR